MSLPSPRGLPEMEDVTSIVGFPSLHAPAEHQNASMHDEIMLPDGDHISYEASADVQSSEGAFLDAKSSLSNMEAGFVPIRVRLSDEGDDEDYEASLATSENFDSASERMGTLSNKDSVSPSGSFKEFFALSEVPSITLNGALRQLNELNSGVSSLDTSLLENTSEEGFRFRLMEIAVSNNLSLDDEVVHDILNALLPVVRENLKQINPVKEAARDYIGAMPVAMPTADDDDDKTHDGLDDVDLEGFEEASDLEQSEDGEFLPYSARGLPVRVATDDESEEHEVYHFLPSLELPMSSQLADPEMEVRHGSAPFDEIENPNSIDYEHAVRGPSMNHENPDLMQHDAQNSGNQDKSMGVNDRVKNREDASVCGLTEADANEDTNLHELQKLGNQAESMHVSEQGATVKDASVSNSADGDINGDTGVRTQQLEETKQEASQSIDAASLQQTLESNSNVGHAFDSSVLSTQQKAFKDILEKGQARFGEECEGAQNIGLEVKDIDDKLLYGTKGGVVAGHSEVMFVNASDTGPEEHPFDGRNSREGTYDEAGKINGEEEAEPTAKRVLSLKSTTAPATSMPFLGNAGPSLPAQPASLGRSIPSLDHASHAVPRSNAASMSSSSMARKGSKTDLAGGMDDTRKKLRMIGVKFLRLAHRLEQSAHNIVVAQVLYRLKLADKLRGERMSRDSSLENLMLRAEEQEAAGQSDLDFECTILVLGKSGVGKSATLNSLFDEAKSGTDAYKPATKKVKEIIGTVNGIKLRIIDTPGLLTSYADQWYNLRVMSSVKHYIKKSPPDIVLYFDRLDMQCRDYGDILLLRTITDTLGGGIWYNVIVVLTHGSSTPPDGANGVPVSHELFVAQRSHVVQQTIRQAAGNMQLMNLVSLVENHVACPVNKAGHCVLPNGQAWKPQLLLLCFASKILAEANTLMKLQDSSPQKSISVRPRVPSLPFLLSSMLQSRAELKLPNQQVDDEEVSDSDEEADSDGEEDYHDLPPFRRLTRDELRLLDKEQRTLYHEELEYREKLFMKKKLKAERARKKELKKRLAAPRKEVSDLIEEHLEEPALAVVPVTMPDMALPPSFDTDNATHRYRCLVTDSQWFVRPVLDTHGWDHDSGYDGLNLEKVFVLSKKLPVSVSGKIIKDKKEASVQMECATSFKNGDGKITQAGLGIQTLGKDVLYTIRSETKFSNFKKNKTTCGLAVTMLGDTVAAGMKLEDCLLVGKRFKLVMNGGALTGQKDVAYGGNLEASLKDKDYPIGRSLSTLGVSIMNWHGDLAIGGNLQLHFLLGKTMIVGRANLNNKKVGQISFRASSSDQLQMAFIGLIPLLRAFIGSSQSM